MSITAKRRVLLVIASCFIFYNIYVYSGATATENPIPETAREGRLVFQKYNCFACHQIYGLGGHMGPDLTNVISDKGEMYARSFIMAGTQKMPRFEMTEKDLNNLIHYLTFVSVTAKYRVENFEPQWSGLVNYNDQDEN